MTNPEVPRVPRTPEEMDELRQGMGLKADANALEKAYARNAKIEFARRAVRMFQTEEFQFFWDEMYTKMKEMTEQSVSSIKGTPATGQRFDPFGQLVELNLIQGGIEMLEAMLHQKVRIEAMAKQEPQDVEVLKSSLEAIKQ